MQTHRMPSFRKKPVVIQAWQWNPNDLEMAGAVVGQLLAADVDFRHGDSDDGVTVLINTLEGTMTASPGDWIIRGVQGEFYPCKPDIFTATYEPVEDAAT